ncbi:lysozyme inhibitor LprI family protein [Halomonas halocynthiae]|uniref:lysozyme inhibitor LprI family protein n=1 Tax=Halomonas halocynthiae TaxID=176290 RepID=UPI0004273CEA|nr:lysozyme inhibitor LprI family protein [Halomonas halocynthiae]
MIPSPVSMISIICVTVLFGMSFNAQSAECNHAVDQSTLNRCADQEFEAADARLNTTYKVLAQQLDAASLERLRQAQRAWVSYRDAQCAFESGPSKDGSIYPMILSGCMEEATTARTSELEAHLSCEEGDVSCVRR